MPEDITNKKFTITLPQLGMIIGVLSTLIGFYYYAKMTIQTLQQTVDTTITSYKDVKGEVKLLHEQMYEMAFLYNRNITSDHEDTHTRKEVSVGHTRGEKRGTVRRDVRDTIDLSLLRMRK